MSNLATADRLRQATSQLAASWYCDPAVLDLEKKTLFDRGPRYVGHELMVPNPGDYYTLAWRDNAQVLVRNASGVELLSNICRHRQAIMLDGRGNTSNIAMPRASASSTAGSASRRRRKRRSAGSQPIKPPFFRLRL